MADKTQSLQGEENQAEDLIKQDYHVRVSDGQKFIVPNALEDVDAPLARMHKPDYSMAVNMPGGPGVTTKLYSTPMAGGFVEARVDPGHSERERHFLHAEVKALQQSLGISYKDAAHRLFMAEVERVKKADSAEKSFAAIRRSLESLVTSDIIPPIVAIDKGELDEYVWRNGKWEERPKQSGPA